MNHESCRAAAAVVNLLMLVLATLSMILPSGRILVASECTNNAAAIATQRLAASYCAFADYAIICPDEQCMTNVDGAGSEIAICYQDKLIEGDDGVTYNYLTGGVWSPGYPSAVATEGTRVEISGSVQGSVEYNVDTANLCLLYVNDQLCSTCILVNCNGNLFFQADCSNLNQGFLDGCDTVNFGSPGDILSHYILVHLACLDMASGQGSTSSGSDAPITEGATETPGGAPTTETPGSGSTPESDTSTSASGILSSTGSLSSKGATVAAGNFASSPSSSAASAGFLEMANMKRVWMFIFATIAVYLG